MGEKLKKDGRKNDFQNTSKCNFIVADPLFSISLNSQTPCSKKAMLFA